MAIFDKNIYREPTDEEIFGGVEFELNTMAGWVQGVYPDILKNNSELDEYKDDEMKLAHAIIRIKK